MHPVQVTEGTVAEALQAAQLVVQATMTETVAAMTVAVTKSVTAMTQPEAVAVTEAAAVAEAEATTMAEAVPGPMTEAEAAEQPATVLAGPVAAGQRRVKLGRAEGGVVVVPSMPPLPETQTLAESEARTEATVSQP
ncbi:hypothetical protein AB1L88_17045 [Tautonia sp. JC769]|uniref:hypothetical protein n=1 Tax=Tautonia sp. JC769 TaxID=3232135 RepID=UPI00345B2FEF